MKKKDPEAGDLVVCTVKDVKDFGVVCILDEFHSKEGFIHISEISSGWIKYIRDYVREGQRIVCKIIDANPARGKFDLSLRKVNDHQRREKLKEWKNEQRATKILENLSAQHKSSFPLERVTDILEEKYGSLSYALDYATSFPEQFMSGLKEHHWARVIVDYAKENLKPPVAKVSGIIQLQSTAGNGIDVVRKALEAGLKGGLEITYAGAPKYRIISYAEDMKTAEENMRKTSEAIIAAIKKAGGYGEGPVKE
ncbi:MAG: translation initiation factor IF-2 subunit alpha [Candidatus Thermoplasmatota archaeon]|jgi:translation initiation factor 2 subunit 1|nr:translation initiation factor IF-2 subunit alpha [Candidatus Thermoplasmatota archaeon]MCL5680846.1 translation initiation factor IF-2 subunit alpha [Candidatus Thermoplasmatota archaeon]